MEPEAQPPSTMPYTPMDAHARMYSTATGKSVSWSGVISCVNGILVAGPNGMTAKMSSAQNTEMMGAAM